MKLNYKQILLGVVLAASGLITACEKQEMEQPQPQSAVLIKQAASQTAKKMASNVHFTRMMQLSEILIRQQQQQVSTLDSTGMKAYFHRLTAAATPSATSEQHIEAIRLLGFADFRSYAKWRNSIAYEYQQLNQAYPSLTQMTEEARADLFQTAQAVQMGEMRFSASQDAAAGNCEQQYANCMGQATADLGVNTIACIGSVFIPVIGPAIGPACEAFVVQKHYYQSKECARIYNFECEQPF